MGQYEFEEKLKTYMRQSGRSQARVAELLGIEKDTFNKWVRGVNRFPAQELLRFCELMKLEEKERAELFELAGHVLLPPVEQEMTKTKKQTTFDQLAQEFRLRREFTPLKQLQLSTESLALVEALDFVGIRWSNLFAFTVGLIKADNLSQAQIEEISQGFSRFNDRIYRRPAELKLTFLAWLVAFTAGGVLCFVFEEECSEERITVIGNQKKGSPAYDKEAGMMWVQTGATTFSWTVDLKTRRLYKHLGKQPDGLNYHARQMVKASENLEAVLEAIIR